MDRLLIQMAIGAWSRDEQWSVFVDVVDPKGRQGLILG